MPEDTNSCFSFPGRVTTCTLLLQRVCPRGFPVLHIHRPIYTCIVVLYRNNALLDWTQNIKWNTIQFFNNKSNIYMFEAYIMMDFMENSYIFWSRWKLGGRLYRYPSRPKAYPWAIGASFLTDAYHRFIRWSIFREDTLKANRLATPHPPQNAGNLWLIFYLPFLH